MKIRLFIFLLLTLILETTVFPYPVTFLVIFLSLSYLGFSFMAESFLIGILFDLFSLKLIGTSSLLYLSILLVGGGFGKQISERNLIFQSGLFTLYMFIYQYLFYKYDLPVIVFNILTGILVLVILNRLIGGETANKRRLAV